MKPQESKQNEGAPQKNFKPAASGLTAEEALKRLAPYGGYKILTSLVKDSNLLDPALPALRNTTLNDKSTAAKRAELRKVSEMWRDSLQSGAPAEQLVTEARQTADVARKLRIENVNKVLEAQRLLEKNYRAVYLQFSNASKSAPNISFINASPEQLGDFANPLFADAVEDEFLDNYDQLDLKYNYSLFAVGGFLGSVDNVRRWAKIVHNCKVLCVSDYRSVGSSGEVEALLKQEKFHDNIPELSHMVMCVNELVGRPRHQEYGETNNVLVSPAMVLVGKINVNNLGVVAAGVKLGGLVGTHGVNFKMRQSMIGKLSREGVIPFTDSHNQKMAFEANTLYSGAKEDLQLKVYSIVRVNDYISKSVCNYLNRQTFTTIESATLRSIKKELEDFLDDLENTAIKGYEPIDVEEDPKDPQRVLVSIKIDPMVAVKGFDVIIDSSYKPGQPAQSTYKLPN